MRPDDPVRKIALPFAGDPWAQPGSQAVPPADQVKRLQVTYGSLRWRVVAYDGVGPSAAPVDGDGSTVDMTVVKIRKDGAGNLTLARTATIVSTEGAEAIVGKQLTEADVSPQELVLLGVVSATQDTAAALWIFVDDGAIEVR